MELKINQVFAINHGIHTAILCGKIYQEWGDSFTASNEKICKLVGIYTMKQTYNHIQKMIKQGVLLVINDTCRPKKYQINADYLHYLVDPGECKKESLTSQMGIYSLEAEQKADKHVHNKPAITSHLGTYCAANEHCAENKLDTKETITSHLGNYCPLFVQFIFIKRFDTIYQKILNNILYIYIKKRKKIIQKKEKNILTYGSTRTMQYQPASGAHYMLSKHILAELNQLVVPLCRKRPFAFSNENLGPIIKQLKNGHSVEDCLRVVKNKFFSWHTETRLHNCLAPKTLFGNKFDNYVGEHDVKPREKNYGKNTNAGTSSKRNATRQCAETLSELGAILNEQEAW